MQWGKAPWLAAVGVGGGVGGRGASVYWAGGLLWGAAETSVSRWWWLPSPVTGLNATGLSTLKWVTPRGVTLTRTPPHPPPGQQPRPGCRWLWPHRPP